MAIVAVCVAVFVVFGLVATGPKDPRAILAEVRTGGGLFNIKRWQAAFELSNALQSRSDLQARARPAVRARGRGAVPGDRRRTGDDLLVRRYLALALGRLGDPRAVPALQQHRAGRRRRRTRRRVIYAAWALGAIGDPAAPCPTCCSSRAATTRASARPPCTRWAVPLPKRSAALAAALADAAVDVRWNAAVALARQGDAARRARAAADDRPRAPRRPCRTSRPSSATTR